MARRKIVITANDLNGFEVKASASIFFDKKWTQGQIYHKKKSIEDNLFNALRDSGFYCQQIKIS